MELDLMYTVKIGDHLAFTTHSEALALAKARQFFHCHTIVSVYRSNNLIHLFRR